MISLAPLLSVFTILVYFGISMFIPFFGYLVPYYKITKVNIYNKKYRLLINLAVFLILYILNVKILMLYLIFPFLSELLFYLTKNYTHKLETYDRVLLMSLLSTSVIFILFYMNKDNIFYNLDKVIELRYIQTDISNLQASILYLKENYLATIFSFLFLGNIFLFLALDSKNYAKWKLSCYWLVPFICIIIFKRMFNYNLSLFLEDNILAIIRYIYTWYGIKIIYSLCEKIELKISLLRHLVSIVLAIFYPLPIFILGALFSFDIIEIKTIKI